MQGKGVGHVLGDSFLSPVNCWARALRLVGLGPFVPQELASLGRTSMSQGLPGLSLECRGQCGREVLQPGAC